MHTTRERIIIPINAAGILKPDMGRALEKQHRVTMLDAVLKGDLIELRFGPDVRGLTEAFLRVFLAPALKFHVILAEAFAEHWSPEERKRHLGETLFNDEYVRPETGPTPEWYKYIGDMGHVFCAFVNAQMQFIGFTDYMFDDGITTESRAEITVIRKNHLDEFNRKVGGYAGALKQPTSNGMKIFVDLMLLYVREYAGNKTLAAADQSEPRRLGHAATLLEALRIHNSFRDNLKLRYAQLADTEKDEAIIVGAFIDAYCERLSKGLAVDLAPSRVCELMHKAMTAAARPAVTHQPAHPMRLES